MSDNIIQLNREIIKIKLKELVHTNVEETLNALLDKEAAELINAEKYERSGDRQGYRSGHYQRNLVTTSGEVKLNVPKLKVIPFETAIIEHYCRRNACWKKPSLKCIWLVFLFAALKISQKLCGEPKYHREL